AGHEPGGARQSRRVVPRGPLAHSGLDNTRRTNVMKKSPDTLRSARWFAPDDLRSFGHRSRMNQIGYAAEEFVGKPVIGIINTWSDFAECHAHFQPRVDDVNGGLLQGGGFPVEMP